MKGQSDDLSDGQRESNPLEDLRLNFWTRALRTCSESTARSAHIQPESSGRPGTV